MPADAGNEAVLKALQTEVERLRVEEERLRVENEHLLEAQRALEDSRDHFVELYDSAPAAWITLDKSGALQNLNLAAVELLGSGRRQLIGAPLAALVVPDDRQLLLAHLLHCPEGHEGSACTVRLARPDGAVPVRVSSRRARGRGEGFTSTLVDLGERQAFAAEYERLSISEREVRAESLAKSQFIAMLSHELRTPLTPVLAAASAFVDSPELSSDLRAAFAIVQRNIKTETQLIDDLLDAARIAHGKMRVEKRAVDLHQTISEALETIADERSSKNQQVTVELSASRSWVDGDPVRLRQVFWNLLRNAIKFTPAAGQIALRSWNHAGRLLVEVSDNGRGIDAPDLARLFEPFQQAPDESPVSLRGLGLGLPICRGILEQHEARIFAHSAGVGKGARFLVELPTIEQRSAPERQPSSLPPPLGAKPRLLLVEDHEDTAEILELLLRRDGFEVRIADSVRAALAIERSSFDLLVSDVGLGDGTGLELMRTLRERGPINGIALSGYGTEDDVSASKEAGFVAHVTKPVNFGELLAAIARAQRYSAGAGQ